MKSDSPVKDSARESQEKLETTASSMSSGMATSTRKALKVEVEKQSESTDELTNNDFAKKPLKHKNSSGTDVKLDSQKDFTEGKVWKPVLTTDEIEKNRGMGMPTPPPLQLLLLLLLRTGAGYRVQSANQKNGIPFDNVKPSSSSRWLLQTNHLHPFTKLHQSHQWLDQRINLHQ
ncbi:MgPa adhesin [Mycoplasmoides genitalium M2288]|nr:MgPa adhesin [Mycoplasmoides genitalium M2288]